MNYINIFGEVTRQVQEETDKFIFETISSWFYKTHNIVISKKMLIRAMICYMEEHSEEYTALSKEVEGGK